MPYKEFETVNSVAKKVTRAQSASEEIANSLSHGVGLLAIMTAGPILIMNAVQRGEVLGVIGASVFATSAVLLYLSSVIYHALPPNRTKQIFQIIDHSAIFLLIAGTYTPFTLGVLQGAWGWTLLGLIWSLAIAGIILKTIFGARYMRLSLLLYLAMGWVVVIAIKPLWALMPAAGLVWLFAGGVAYTGGVVFYAAHHVRYSHLVWHLFVLSGTACHFVAVYFYAG